MQKNVIIIGAGGHGKVIADIVEASGDKLIGFFDDNLSGKIMGYDILGKTENYAEYPEAFFVIAVGNNKIRRKIAEKIKGAKLYTAIHPSASVSKYAKIGAGSVVCAGGVVAPEVKLGEHCIVNHGAVADHECKIGAFTHISPNASVCGQCEIGESCHIGAGAVIKNNVFICKNVTVGIGAAVAKSIDESGTYVGIPAVRIK